MTMSSFAKSFEENDNALLLLFFCRDKEPLRSLSILRCGPHTSNTTERADLQITRPSVDRPSVMYDLQSRTR